MPRRRLPALLVLALPGFALVSGCDSSASSATTRQVTTTTGVSADPAVNLRPVLACEFGGSVPSAPPSGSGPSPTILPTEDGQCLVGPIGATGAIFADATATEDPSGGWGIVVTLRPGADGEDVLNALAEHCFRLDDTCPSGQLAIVVDDVIVSSPAIQSPTFAGSVQIAGQFDEAGAEQLAAVFRANT